MPSPAPSIDLCYAIEDAVHQALGTLLTAAGVTPSIPLDTADLPPISVIPLFSLGASDGHLHKLPTGSYEYDLFPRSTIVVELSVPRMSKDPIVIAGVYTVLAQQLVKIRQTLGFRMGDSLNALLLYHALTHLVPAGTQLGLSEERMEDIATIAYGCTAGIRSTAWPLP